MMMVRRGGRKLHNRLKGARPHGPREPEQRVEPPLEEHATLDDDKVDEASMESFPASDPPGYIPAAVGCPR